jgi:hypothetical protein
MLYVVNFGAQFLRKRCSKLTPRSVPKNIKPQIKITDHDGVNYLILNYLTFQPGTVWNTLKRLISQ